MRGDDSLVRWKVLLPILLFFAAALTAMLAWADHEHKALRAEVRDQRLETKADLGEISHQQTRLLEEFGNLRVMIERRLPRESGHGYGPGP